jgi:aldose sugar dehydrogenase
MAQPLHDWVPSISPSGMMFYEGDASPGWQGALSGELLARLELDGAQVVAEERLLEGVLGRIRDGREGPRWLPLPADRRGRRQARALELA